MSSPIAIFGPGILIGTRTDLTPTGPAINVGFVNEFNIDFAGTAKQLYGQYQFPLVVARGTIKATGKFKNAVLSGIAMNALFYGETLSTTSGLLAWNIDSTYTVPASTVAVQVGSSLTFDADLGVKYSTTGLPLQRVSTGLEALGKYSVTASSPGLYNFITADENANLKITYTSSTGTGQSLVYQNQLIGYTPTFQLDYYTNLNQPTAKPFVVRPYSCVSEKLAMAFKLEDFMLPEIDFGLFANPQGQVFNDVWPEIS